MSFLNLNEHIDPTHFAAWLAQRPRPAAWHPIGSAYHNTYRPDETQWRGHVSMLSMQQFYEAKSWDRGPHFYLAGGTSADGIWAMTPPEQPGIHAGGCNATRFGIEVVGDFQTKPMSGNKLLLLSNVIADLHRWAGLGIDIVAHRDCMPGRTCPGNAAYAQKADIVAMVALALAAPNPPYAPLPRYSENSPILSTPLAPSVPFSGAHGEYLVNDVAFIVANYWRICMSVGVDPILAFAQCLHETANLTSFWGQRPQRNPAGIGVNGKWRDTDDPPRPQNGWAFNTQRDRWERGVSFTSWAEDAIPSHIGRLLCYLLPTGTGTPEQQALIQRALASRVFPISARGSAQTLKQLGAVHNSSGFGWADPGDKYGQAIATVANRLLDLV